MLPITASLLFRGFGVNENVPRVLEDCKLTYPSDYVPTSLLKSLRALSVSRHFSSASLWYGRREMKPRQGRDLEGIAACCTDTHTVKEVTAVLAERMTSRIGQVSVAITSMMQCHAA